MLPQTLLPTLALISSAFALPADSPVTTTEKWSLSSFSILSDSHGPGPSTNTTESISLALSKSGAPFSTCAANWTFSTSVDTVPTGWLPCSAPNLWFRINRKPDSVHPERFNFPPVDLEFLEAGVWQEGKDGKGYLDQKTAALSLVELSSVTIEGGVGLGCARHHPSRTWTCQAMKKNWSGGDLKMEFEVKVSKVTN